MADGTLRIEVAAQPVLSYAMAHNGSPVLTSLRLYHDGPTAYGVEVTVEVRDGDGPVSRPCTVAVDLDGGPTGLEIDPAAIGLELDPDAMWQLGDERPGSLRVVASYAGEVLAEATRPIRLLPGAHWRTEPRGLAHELLASFVMPNDPAVNRLLAEASELLRQRTGSPSLEGYQSGPERVDDIVRAVWDAVAARRITYVEPPASWGAAGQQVRTPTVVLDDRVGTCLDLTVTLAAVLEQAGLRPLLWLSERHAFVGHWRDEAALDAICSPGAEEVVNHVDLGRIRLLETTAVTARADPVSCDDAHRLALAHLADPGEVQAVVDVRVARQHRILPLPARRQTPAGVQIVAYTPAAHAAPALVLDARTERPAAGPATAAPPRVQQWKNALLDLSLRNRLINYTPRSGVGLVVPEGRLGVIEDLLADGRALWLRPSDQVPAVSAERGVADAATLPFATLDDELLTKRAVFTDVTAAAYAARMRGLAHQARTVQEETGANNLYLTLGQLSWQLDGRPLTSPLVLVPVRLVSARGRPHRIELDETGASTPNHCLLEKLRQVHGLDLAALDTTDDPDGPAGLDLPAVLDAVRRALAQAQLPFRVVESASLALLQFAKYRLWRDLDEHWSQLCTNSLVQHLVETPTEAYADPVPPPEAPDLDALDARCPVGADASQLAAVAEAVAGRTFVLEGPPGTGKSQTITNLLTRAVADGQRVLFVAEKRAALSVVQTRLAAVGMGPFSLDLHDKGSRPNAVRAQIRAAMGDAVPVDEQGLAVLDGDLATSRRTLASYATRLHEPDAAGLSYYSARTLALTLGDGPVLDVPTALVATDAAPLVGVREALRLLADVAGPAAPSADHPWGFCAGTADPAAVVGAAARVRDALALVPHTGLQAVLEAARTPDELAVVADLAGFVATPHPVLASSTPAALDLPLLEIDAQARAAADSFLLVRGRRLKAVWARLGPGLAPGAVVGKRDVPALAAGLLAVQQAVHGLAARLQDAGLDLPPRWHPFVGGPPPGGPPGPLREWVAAGAPASAAERTTAAGLADGWRTLAEAGAAGPHDVRRWAGDAGLLKRWRRTEPARAVDPGAALLGVTRWAALHHRLAPLREAGMAAAADRLLAGEVHHDDAAKALERGVAAAAQAERRAATGLDAFDPVTHTRAVDRFTTALAGMRRELAGAVPAELAAERGFRASATSGLVGELGREVARQRGGLGVRALMTRYGDLVTRLLPITLVSPDSVARFFPVGAQHFDLVVFDEASQIRVADAIGAMGRADAVVVVGDSKQLPPTSFGEVALSDDETLEAACEDGESILTEAVAARVPQRWLTWHYRSQDESLIAFSNHHYYADRLSSFPSPARPASSTEERVASGRGISLVRVDGTFHRTATTGPLRTNPVEAEAIVADLRRRFDASPGVAPSVGVVTFNAQQRAHVESLLRDCDDPRLGEALDATAGEGLFVKNLENVQGDERDVILFSTAFSVNQRGVLPLNFGPLTRAGGERRLNVAITRARRQVVLYSSFDPEQVRVEETQSIGVRHLRAYLELARRGPDALAPRTAGRRRPGDRHRDEIAARLRAGGLAVLTDVGLSEFRVDLALAAYDDPDRPLVAVLLDGPGWAARRTVGDRDGLPVEVLDRLMGWPAVERVWAPDWVARPETVADRLVRVVAETRARASEPPVPPPVAPRALTTYAVLGVAPTPAGPPGRTTYVPFVPGARGPRSVLDALPDPAAAEQVRAVAREVVETEGPVHHERLARLVAACFDLSRLSSARFEAVLSCLPSEAASYDEEPFAWPATLDAGTWVGFRPAADRPVEQVCLRELGNAMAALCGDTAGMAEAELMSETLALFGGRRRTPVLLARLGAARDLALVRELLRVDAGGVHRAVR